MRQLATKWDAEGREELEIIDTCEDVIREISDDDAATMPMLDVSYQADVSTPKATNRLPSGNMTKDAQGNLTIDTKLSHSIFGQATTFSPAQTAVSPQAGRTGGEVAGQTVENMEEDPVIKSFHQNVTVDQLMPLVNAGTIDLDASSSDDIEMIEPPRAAYHPSLRRIVDEEDAASSDTGKHLYHVKPCRKCVNSCY